MGRGEDVYNLHNCHANKTHVFWEEEQRAIADFFL